MLEYSKLILSKVSFDPHLFKKELKKALAWVNQNEKRLLLQWCLMEFGHRYSGIIKSFLSQFKG
jgi:hypothetical protein